MTGKQLIKIGCKLYGRDRWQTGMAHALGVDVSTIRRWVYANAVPGPAAAALECFSREAKPHIEGTTPR
jgi:hypothetical protein